MKKTTNLFIIILCIVMSLTQFASAVSFSDMPAESHWAYQALTSAASKGLLTGSDGKIMPFDYLTRAQMATILVRAYQKTEQADITEYTDVSPASWYYANMAIAVKMQIFRGDGSGKLNPDNQITRQEVFVVLARAIGVTSDDVSVLDGFTDGSSVAAWAQGATAYLISKGYVKGSDGKINPTNQITRAEFAQLMYNLVDAGVIQLSTPAGLTVEDKPADDDGEFGDLVFF